MRTVRWHLILALILLCGASSAAGADDVAEGKQLYLRYCSACHGASGKGDGIVSQSMRPHPTDLTLLAKGEGGTFQMADIAGRIDGRETERAHGDPDMPVWGETLRTARSGAGGTEVTGKVRMIVDYLATIQAK